MIQGHYRQKKGGLLVRRKRVKKTHCPILTALYLKIEKLLLGAQSARRSGY